MKWQWPPRTYSDQTRASSPAVTSSSTVASSRLCARVYCPPPPKGSGYRPNPGKTTMPPNQRAQQNHDELFPGHVSTLAVTDPEFIEVFDNFAFDEVLSHGNLDKRTRLMVQLAAIIASQAVREYRVMLGAALNVGVTSIDAKEIVYQAVP